MKNAFILLLSIFPLFGFSQYQIESIQYESIQPIVNSTNIVYTNGNVYSDVITLPFNFKFFGRSETRLKIGPNGGVSFNASANGGWEDYLPQVFPNSHWRATKNAILVHHDLDPTQGGTISYGVEGQAPQRIFKINYFEVPHYNCNEITSTFQFALYEMTNRIEIHVGNKPVCTNWNTGYAAIALHNYNGTEAAIPQNRNSGVWTATNEAWRFTPDPIELTVDFCWETGDPMPVFNLAELVSQSNEFENINSFSLHHSSDPVSSGNAINNPDFYILPYVPHQVYIRVTTSEGPVNVGEIVFSGDCKDESNVEKVYCHSENASLPTLDIHAAFIENYKGDLTKITSPIRFYSTYLDAYYSMNEITNTEDYSMTKMNEMLIVTFLESNGWWDYYRTYKLTLRPVICSDQGLLARSIATEQIEIAEAEYELSIYPNPAQNVLFIKGHPLNKLNIFTIYNSQGKRVLTHEVSYSTEQISIQNLPIGLYAITGQIDGRLFSKKFIKQ